METISHADLQLSAQHADSDGRVVLARPSHHSNVIAKCDPRYVLFVNDIIAVFTMPSAN